jgi:thiol:disulfide interchange protein DsbD
MQMKKKLYLVVLAFLFISAGFAQIVEPVKWNYTKKELGNNEYELIFKATIDKGWHLYSQNIGDNGPIPTSFVFNNLDGFEFVDKSIKIKRVESFEPNSDSLYQVTFDETKPIVEFDPNFNMKLKFYADNAEFKSQIRVTSPEPVVIKGFLEFMCCDDEKCLPPDERDFEFSLPGTTGETAVISTGSQEELKATDGSLEFNANKSMWDIIIEAIIWGFVALLTPCVFPMIPMTITFFLKGGQNKRQGRIQASAYGISIVLLYTIPIAVIILITYFVGGKTVTTDIFNWLSTHWLPNVFFFLIFMFFAASFLGMFEIILPSWMVSKADSKADKGGIVGAFFMALTLVLVSFSCTGPLVGTVLVKSAQGAVFEPIFAMLAFSVAFALPFTLFAFFPGWLKQMPKSGGWLNSVKVVLGFIEIALGLKFLSIADQTYHWGILDREVYLAIWIVTFFLLGLYFLGKIKFANDSDYPYLSVPRLGLAIITFTFVVYLIPGMWGAPLKALSGYLPPQQTHDFDLNAIIRDNLKTISITGSGEDPTELCEKPKYADFLHLPHGLEGYFDYNQGMSCAKKLNKPVFIDFTGHGCVNCREMEANVWSDPKVLKILRNDFVVIALYVDDKTRLLEEEWVTSEYDGKVKKSIGKKNADFQVSRFEMNAQPFYVLLDNKGELLARPRSYDLDVTAFVDFLKTGIKAYKEREKN